MRWPEAGEQQPADMVRRYALYVIPWLSAVCALATVAAVINGDTRRMILGLLLLAVLLGTDVNHRRILQQRQDR